MSAIAAQDCDVEALVRDASIPDDLTLPIVIKFLYHCAWSLRAKGHTESAAGLEAQAYGLMRAYAMEFLDEFGGPGSTRL